MTDQRLTAAPREAQVNFIPLASLVADYQPGGDWKTWEEVEVALLSAICLCCGQPGHYQRMLEAHLSASGLTKGVYLEGGRLMDGHHRVTAARRLGIDVIPLETREEAAERWVRQHGRVDWRHRAEGDVPDYDTLHWCTAARVEPGRGALEHHRSQGRQNDSVIPSSPGADSIDGEGNTP